MGFPLPTPGAMKLAGLAGGGGLAGLSSPGLSFLKLLSRFTLNEVLVLLVFEGGGAGLFGGVAPVVLLRWPAREARCSGETPVDGWLL